MEFICRPTERGFNLGERNTAIFLAYVKENPRIPWRLTPVLPESNKQRGFLEGAVIPLVAFYDEGMDHRNYADVRRVRDWLKEEFFTEMVVVAGKVHSVPRSTKGREALQGFLERVLAWLQENYAPPAEALDPERFKEWRDTIFPNGGPDHYIDYLVSLNILKL